MATYSPSKITKDGNTYNFTDATKIPLAGTNALAGSIVPSTDNAYDFGDSSHNFKIVYAKEIRHGLSSNSLILSGGNGTTNGANLVLYGTNRSDGFKGRFDLVAKGSSDYKLTGKSDGTLTWDGDIVDVIEEQGNGYIRYSNGLQICWGSISWQSSCSTAWGSLYETSSASESYAKSFVGAPSVSASGVIGKSSAMIDSSIGDTTTTPMFYLCRATASSTISTCTVCYMAIGRWK